MGYDFKGYATRNNLKCSDGRVIRKNAFKENDGKRVPLVWNHQHNDPDMCLGHADLKNEEDGVVAYCSFNDTAKAQNAKKAVQHGDVVSLSIWANNLRQEADDVLHGVIREVSLVLAGANPGAFIESVMTHGMPMDEDDDEAILYTGDGIVIGGEIAHADEGQKKDPEPPKKTDENKSDKTVGEIFNSLNEEQKTAVAIIVGQAVADSKKDEKNEGGNEKMGHSIFDQEGREKDQRKTRILSHSDGMAIIEAAKKVGSLRQAFRDYIGDEDVIVHAVPMQGMTGTTDTNTYGVRGMDMLMPEYRNQNMPPEFISRDMGWVGKVLRAVHNLPYERIKLMYADITEDDARAKGYIKGDQKWPEVFSVLNRIVEGQTIYKLQKLDRDDIITITEFDLVPWIKREMDVMLDEEKARAILIGDGRLLTDKFKIKEDRIIPVVKDVPLFNVRVKVKPGSTDAETAETTIDTIIRARKQYKGSGEPTFYTTEDIITEMLLLKDKIGHKIYKTMQELATALRVKEIVPVEPMSGYKLDGEDLIGTIVNLDDYAVGQNPKAKRDMFEDFDIDFNQYTYLKEERFSGCLRKPYSALTITIQTSTSSSGGSSSSGTGDGTGENA